MKEKLTIKDLIQQALENMMPTVGEIACNASGNTKEGEIAFGTASDTVKILFTLKGQKEDECEALCVKRHRRNPEEEESHFGLHIITEVLDKLFWNEIQFWSGVKNYDELDGFGMRPNWQVVGFKEDGSTPVVEEISRASIFQILMDKLAEEMKNPAPEKITAGGELQEGQIDLGEMTPYEKALALIFFKANNEHTALLTSGSDDLPQLFEKAILVDIASLLFKEEVRFRLGSENKGFSQIIFLDNWHIAGEETSEEDVVLDIIELSPFGMAAAMLAMRRAFKED